MQRDFCFSLSFQTKYLTLININQNYLIRTRLARTNSLAIVHSASYNAFSRLEVILRQNVGCSLITTGHEAPRSYQSAQGRITQGCGDDGYGSERPADKEGGLRTQGMRTEWQMGMERRSQEWEWRWRNDSTCGVCVYVRIYISTYTERRCLLPRLEPRCRRCGIDPPLATTFCRGSRTERDL